MIRLEPVALRILIIETARSWIGTPYHHQAALKGVGCDCLGLVRGVWREVYGEEPEAPPSYSPDWAERSGRETLMEAAGRHMAAKPKRLAAPGDVVLFRVVASGPAKHAAIIGQDARGLTMIHAYAGYAVKETAYGEAWQKRAAFAFTFPGAA